MKTRVHRTATFDADTETNVTATNANSETPSSATLSSDTADSGATGAATAAPADAADASVAPSRPPKNRRRVATAIMSVLTLASLGGFGYMGWVGVDAARNVVGGTAQEIITDPTAPGFVAVVDDTRVSAVAVTTAEGTLDSVLIFPESTTDGGTSVTWILGELLVPNDEDVPEDTPERAMRDVFAEGGLDAVIEATARVLGFKVSDGIVAGPADLAAIADFVAPVEIRNPTAVRVDTGDGVEVKFPSGTLQLDSAQLSEFMTLESYNDPGENRGLRAEIGLDALGVELANLVKSNPDLEPAEDPTDLGGYLIRWGLGDHRFISLPVTPIPYMAAFLYRPDVERIADVVAAEVPFPASAFPGQRPRARILNGTSDTTKAESLASEIAALGTEVSTIGNATAFDVSQTSVLYSDEAFADVAQRVAEYLGASAAQSDALSDASDIDVVLGANLKR